MSIGHSGDIFLGPVGQERELSRIGRSFSEGRIELARTERTASGRLVSDIIAVKKTFKLSYDLIDGDELRAIIALYDLQDELTLIVWEEYDTKYTYTVRLKPFERSRVQSHGQGLWSGVTFELEEV